MRLREALVVFFQKTSSLLLRGIRFCLRPLLQLIRFCLHPRQDARPRMPNSVGVSLVSQNSTAVVTSTLFVPEEAKNALPESIYNQPRESKIAPKLRWKKAITKIQEQQNSPPQLTVAAANFMFDHCLTMRNSYTTQVMSLHYKIRRFPKTHSAGGGQYGVPLWTVKLKELPKPGQDPYDRCHSDNFAFTGVSEEAKQQHLDNFLDKIKSFLRVYVPFGFGFGGKYFDYELLVAKPLSRSFYLSDIGTYSTGGRAHAMYNAQTIVYRATLNMCEIQFIKDILERKYDARIPGIHENPEILEVITNSARYVVCQHLCIEIIAAKLVLFLNTADQSKYNVITLNAEQLDVLLARAITVATPEIQWIFQTRQMNSLLFDNPPKKYLESEKYPPYEEKSTINKLK